MNQERIDHINDIANDMVLKVNDIVVETLKKRTENADFDPIFIFQIMANFITALSRNIICNISILAKSDPLEVYDCISKDLLANINNHKDHLKEIGDVTDLNIPGKLNG